MVTFAYCYFCLATYYCLATISRLACLLPLQSCSTLALCIILLPFFCNLPYRENSCYEWTTLVSTLLHLFCLGWFLAFGTLILEPLYLSIRAYFSPFELVKNSKGFWVSFRHFHTLDQKMKWRLSFFLSLSHSGLKIETTVKFFFRFSHLGSKSKNDTECILRCDHAH